MVVIVVVVVVVIILMRICTLQNTAYVDVGTIIEVKVTPGLFRQHVRRRYGRNPIADPLARSGFGTEPKGTIIIIL